MNIVKYTTVVTEDECYKISALLTEKGYDMPSLTVNKNGKNETWDNELFLIQLYNFLNNKSLKDVYEFKKAIPFKDRPVVLKLFQESIDLNLFGDMFEQPVEFKCLDEYAPKGTIVKLNLSDNLEILGGDENDRRHVNDYIELDQFLTVKKIEIGGFKNIVYFREIEEVGFNVECFIEK